jgi:ABC-type uncharacterized transport system YnjBCD substrate-binding protein
VIRYFLNLHFEVKTVTALTPGSFSKRCATLPLKIGVEGIAMVLSIKKGCSCDAATLLMINYDLVSKAKSVKILTWIIRIPSLYHHTTFLIRKNGF